MTYGLHIRAREADEYAAQGYYVVRNISQASIQVSEHGLHVKVGGTMAIKEFDSYCKKAESKGQIRVLATPVQEMPKKDKKKTTESPTPEVAVDRLAPADDFVENPSLTIVEPEVTVGEVSNESSEI